MNPMLIPLMIYQGWLQMFFAVPKPAEEMDVPAVGYEG